MESPTNKLSLVFLSLLLGCTACSKAPPAASIATVVATPATNQYCEQFDELMKMALSHDLHDFSAEKFIEKYKNLIQVKADEVDYLLAPRKTRGITFIATKGNWLTSAKIVYISDADNLLHMQFFTSYFGINQSCIPHSKELDTRLSKFKPTSKNFTPDNEKEMFWHWHTKDPKDITMSRHIMFRAKRTDFSMEIWQNPASEDGSEAEREGEGAYD